MAPSFLNKPKPKLTQGLKIKTSGRIVPKAPVVPHSVKNISRMSLGSFVRSN